MLELSLPGDHCLGGLDPADRVDGEGVEEFVGSFAESADVVHDKREHAIAVFGLFVGCGCANGSGRVLLAEQELSAVGGEEAGNRDVHVEMPEGAVMLNVHATGGAVGAGVWLLCGGAPPRKRP